MRYPYFPKIQPKIKNAHSDQHTDENGLGKNNNKNNNFKKNRDIFSAQQIKDNSQSLKEINHKKQD